MTAIDSYIRWHLRPRQLQLLIILDELRNLSATAEHLNITQSAVSKSLAEIERGLALKLFERTARGVHPTVFGECLLQYARNVLAELTRAREDLNALSTGTHGKISIGVLPATNFFTLAKAISKTKQKSPRTVVFVREGTMSTLLPDLRADKLDLIFGSLPESGSDLEEIVFSEIRNVFVVRRGHPVAKHKSVSWPQLVEFPWILPPSGSLSREPLEHAFEQHCTAMPVDFIETLSVQLISHYVRETDAIGVLTSEIAESYEARKVLSILPVALPPLVRPVGVARRKNKPSSPIVDEFLKCLGEAMRKSDES